MILKRCIIESAKYITPSVSFHLSYTAHFLSLNDLAFDEIKAYKIGERGSVKSASEGGTDR